MIYCSATQACWPLKHLGQRCSAVRSSGASSCTSPAVTPEHALGPARPCCSMLATGVGVRLGKGRPRTLRVRPSRGRPPRWNWIEKRLVPRLRGSRGLRAAPSPGREAAECSGCGCMRRWPVRRSGPSERPARPSAAQVRQPPPSLTLNCLRWRAGPREGGRPEGTRGLPRSVTCSLVWRTPAQAPRLLCV